MNPLLVFKDIEVLISEILWNIQSTFRGSLGLFNSWLFKIVGEQVGQVFGVIVVVTVDIIQEENEPFSEVHFTCFTTPHHGIDDGGIFGSIVIPAEQPIFSTQIMESFP